MIIPNQKIRIQIEITCEECDGAGRVSGLTEKDNPGSAYEIECDSCEGTGYQTQYVSLNELKSIMESGE